MRHAGTQTIETERLLLRPLTPEDAPMMYTNWANDPDVTRWLRWEPHKNVDETRELLAAWALLYPNGDYYQWGIVEKATGQVFGSISIFTSSSAEPERDLYCGGSAWWRCASPPRRRARSGAGNGCFGSIAAGRALQ